ncbi:MAG TPA: zf-HC2 domain-containing protein [Candidatus Eisenbacteria bacterium]
MIHLTLQQISSYIDAELPEASVELVRLHLSACAECTERFARMEEQEAILARVLTIDPGPEFFEGLLDDLSGRKGDFRKRAKRKPPAADPAPRGERASQGPRPDPAADGPPRRGGSIWIAVALALIAASLAVIAVRRAPHASAPRTPDGSPGAGAPFAAARGATAERGDPLTVLESAAHMSSDAERSGTAPAFDAAAEAWTRALPSLRDDPAEEAAGRAELMEARYRAWALEPSPARRAAATGAVRGYLVVAPSDAQRDSAWAWLARLKR